MTRAKDTPRSGATFQGALKAFGVLGLLVAVALGLDWLLRAENFPVRQIRFEGPFKHVTRAQLEAVVTPVARGNFLLVDLGLVQRRVEEIPWVHEAHVWRGLPGELRVRYREQQLVARWNETGWVNHLGEEVRVDGGAASGLPDLAGPPDTSAQVLTHYREFGARLATAGLTITALTLTERRTWRVEIAPGAQAPGEALVIVLDRDRPLPKLERFARVYAQTLSTQVAAIKQVDLRYTNGFAVEWRGTQAGVRCDRGMRGGTKMCAPDFSAQRDRAAEPDGLLQTSADVKERHGA